jgi:hypothetical protein
MDIQGKIITALEPRSGKSNRTGNNWKSQDFVIETHEQYPKKCVFTVFGEDRLNQFALKVGDEVTVSIDIDAHEYNGRWFNDIRAWRVTRGDASAATPAAPAATPAAPVGAPAAVAPAAPADDPLAGGDGNDDLPF